LIAVRVQEALLSLVRDRGAVADHQPIDALVFTLRDT
jgi:hypothetical protein